MICITSLDDLVKEYAAAARWLREAVRLRFPLLSWVQVNSSTPFVGKVFNYTDDPDWIVLLLEHGQPRTFRVTELTPCKKPTWAKRKAATK